MLITTWVLVAFFNCSVYECSEGESTDVADFFSEEACKEEKAEVEKLAIIDYGVCVAVQQTVNKQGT